LNIDFSIPETSDVSLRILNTTGQQVGDVHTWETESSGTHSHSVELNSLPSGIYYCRFETKSFSLTRKLVIIR
jgi:hypothetical protein